MTSITKTEWYSILATEYNKYSWITKAMNEQQMSELYSKIRIELKSKYKVI